MIIQELYDKAVEDDVCSVIAVIEFLIFEKAQITFYDDVSKLDYYFEGRFKKGMNKILIDYMNRRGMIDLER